jgi:hypothetical protein
MLRLNLISRPCCIDFILDYSISGSEYYLLFHLLFLVRQNCCCSSQNFLARSSFGFIGLIRRDLF